MKIKDLLGVGPGTYDVQTVCDNCNTKQMTAIKKGNKAEDVIQNGRCENCGCMALKLKN